MYAITFWALVEQSLKLDGERYRTLANISVLPHLSSSNARNVVQDLEHYGEPPINVDKERIKKDREALRKLIKGQ